MTSARLSGGRRGTTSFRSAAGVIRRRTSRVWTAVAVYVLVAIVRKRLQIEAPLYSFLQVLSLTLFEKMPILRAFSSLPDEPDDGGFDNQLNLFGY